MISKFIFTLLNQVIEFFFNNNLTEFLTGAKMWELCFSYDKCQLLQVGYSDPSVHYNLGNYVITKSDAICDLGVNIHSSLKPYFHISTIVRKVNICSKSILK